ncbi:MAG TPA: 6,7-dimethyl-8-ribityllumazine synthase [Actinomycetota bacterium]
MAGSGPPAGDLDARDLVIPVVVARFHPDITDKLLDGALRVLKDAGATDTAVHRVPGAFELPLACKRVIDGGVHAVVALGCIIRGETPHFDFVASACAQGLMDVSTSTGIPIAFGVLTTETKAQAQARATGRGSWSNRAGNKGSDAAAVAIEMALFGL